MKSTRLIRAVATGVAASILCTSCLMTSRITTNPPGAKIYINETYIGDTEGPRLYRYRAGLPETYYVRIEKPGYKDVKGLTIERAYRADVSLALLVLAIVPYFFSARLEDQYTFDLEPLAGTAPETTTETVPPANPLSPQ